MWAPAGVGRGPASNTAYPITHRHTVNILPDPDPVPNPNLVFPDSDRGPRCNRARLNLHPLSRTLAATPRTGVSCGRPLGPGADKTSTPKTPCTLSSTPPTKSIPPPI